jgi:hypothetical protein
MMLLSDHPRYRAHFTRTGSSWLNAGERFFSETSSKRIRRGTFRSVRELEKAITKFVAEHNAEAQPFVWTNGENNITENHRNVIQSMG